MSMCEIVACACGWQGTVPPEHAVLHAPRGSDACAGRTCEQRACSFRHACLSPDGESSPNLPADAVGAPSAPPLWKCNYTELRRTNRRSTGLNGGAGGGYYSMRQCCCCRSLDRFVSNRSKTARTFGHGHFWSVFWSAQTNCTKFRGRTGQKPAPQTRPK